MRNRTGLVLAAALVGAVVVAYLPALRAGFVWNDDTYLTRNATLDEAGGLRRIWTDPRANEQYYPAVFTSFWLEKRLWALHPFGYHLVNVLLHAGSALLLWWLLRRLGLPGGWFAAALFALHPVGVESVAWVTERKNTLSLLLTLLAAHAYLASASARDARAGPRGRRPAPPGPWYRTPRALYGAALAFFTLALLAKTTAAVLPAVLLVIAWWRTGRVRWADARPLVPFFVVGAALALNTAWLERAMVGASGAEWSLSALGRVVLAGRVLAFYLGKLVWPAGLAFIYPRWTIDPAAWIQWLPALAALAAVAALVALRRRIGRGPLAASLLFGGVLFPAMGFFNVYAMRYSYVADHFAYQAVAVFAAALAAGVAGLLEGKGRALRAAAAAAGVLVVATLAVLTFRQARSFRDADTLWRDTLAANPACFMCRNNYGYSLYTRGRVADAVAEFERSLRLQPDNVPALLNLARVDEDRDDLDGAIARLRVARRVEPDNTTVMVNLATDYTKTGRYDEAKVEYRKALAHPSANDYLAHNGLGVVLVHEGDVAGAVEQFRAALAAKPGYWMAQANLEKALPRLGVPTAEPPQP